MVSVQVCSDAGLMLSSSPTFEQQRYEGDGRGAELGERQAVRPVIEGGVLQSETRARGFKKAS